MNKELIEALKRNESKEIVIRDTNNGLSMKTVRCGNCDDKILVGYMSDIRSKYSKYKFCKNCGVPLDWGKIDEV